MKDKVLRQQQIYLSLFGIYLALLIVAIIANLLIDKNDHFLEVVMLGLYLILYAVMFSHKISEFIVYKQTNGSTLIEPTMNSYLCLLCISLLIELYYIYSVVQQNSMFIYLLIFCVFANPELLNNKSPFIVFEKDRIYFKNTWIKYSDIRKIDSDKSVKSYVIVYIFTNKSNSISIHTKLYKRFVEEGTNYLPFPIV
ncbi:MAG: hypothetical protein RR602_05980 [Longicatena sp.]